MADSYEREKQSLVEALRSVTIPRLLARDLDSAELLLWDLFQADSSSSMTSHSSKFNVCLFACLFSVVISTLHTCMYYACYYICRL